MKKIRSEQNASGIAGCARWKDGPAASQVYYMLHSLQHRGSDGCGIASADGESIFNYKSQGMLSETLKPDVLAELPGELAIGQVRMKTESDRQEENLQPVRVRAHQGQLALVCSGMLTNGPSLRLQMQKEGLIFQGTSDAEILAHLIQRGTGRIQERIEQTIAKIHGPITFLLMTKNTMYAFRSADGIRPLYMALDGEGGAAFASESCGFALMEPEEIREVKAGELVVMGKEGFRSQPLRLGKPRPCSMETVYYSRMDSDYGQTSVYEIRKKAGEKLAEKETVDADLVIGVPDTAMAAASAFAWKLKKPYETGLIKNRYIGSTFIRPTSMQREQGLRVRLSTISSVLKGKSVYLIDDSIQKGDTSIRLCQLLREAGAREVHLRIASPMILQSCCYGTEYIPESDLIANHYTEEEMALYFNADTVRFLSPEEFASVLPVSGCMACFGCSHPAPIEDYEPQDED